MPFSQYAKRRVNTHEKQTSIAINCSPTAIKLLAERHMGMYISSLQQ